MKLINTIIYMWMLLALVSCSFSNVEKSELIETQQKEKECTNEIKYSEIKTSVFETEDGWGYEIIINDKIYIHQSYIPTIRGQKSFSSKEDAFKVAKYVAAKLKKNHKLPSLTYAELDSLKVL